MRWLLAACGSCLLFSAAVFGTFEPLQIADGVEYLFAWPPAATLLAAWLTCVVGLVTVFLVVRALARARSPEHLAEADSGRWLAPVAALGAVAFGILPAVPGIGEHGAVVAYFLYDLRWWWTFALVALTIARADRLVGAPAGRFVRELDGWSTAARLLLLDSTIFVGVVVWALATTVIRFDNTLSGDEPKFVRYCEVWYQGGGLDISGLKLVRDQPLDARPALLRNGTLLVGAISQDAGLLARDLRNFVRDPRGFQWNRARADNGFVTGIHGGLYEVHQPGLCALLFPGYFADRYLLNVDSSPDGKWPADLTMTDLTMLLTYGLCAVVLFRLLRHALGSEGLAWIWAAIAMMTLPTTAFAFQLYAELPALLIVLAVSNELLFSDRSRPLAAAVAGTALGALAWIHVRFLFVCLCLVMLALFKRTGRARWAFLSTFGLLLLSLLALDYHVSGSWWPTALWEDDGRGVIFNSMGFVLNFIAYGLDRPWGLLPHSLLLVGALPGLLVLSRISRGHALFVAAIVLALLAPSAAHTLSAAGTTPDRLVVAVVPLLIWPVAVLARRFWNSEVIRVLTIVLGVLSLDAGLAYNENHYKRYGSMRDVSLSGWKPNLSFPIIRADPWSTSHANFVLFLCLLALVLGLSLLAYWRAARPASGGPAPTRRAWLVPTIAVAVLIGGFSAATSANADWTRPDYLVHDDRARAAAARALVSVDRCFCFTSARGHVDWTRLKPNSAHGVLLGATADNLRVNVRVVVEGDGKVPAFGRVRVEFGDGGEVPWRGLFPEVRVAHAYSRPGAYQLNVWLQLPDQVSPRLFKETLEVRSGK